MQIQIAILVLILAAGLAAWELSRLGIHQGYAPQQPIAFPHRIHAGDYRIPCQYCHYAARASRHAGIPPASVCMNCHKLLDRQTREIEKLKEAVQQQRPIRWIKVHNLPDFVHFNHSRHVLSGVACRECHGAVEAMDRVEQAAPLTMGWCLDCHRQHAHVATTGLGRVVQTFSRPPKPSTGLDCISCHY